MTGDGIVVLFLGFLFIAVVLWDVIDWDHS
jgi:hypothetical protein